MENKNGSGILLGVVSVATLIVAIIGATFAYFSASANSANDAVNLTAYEFDVKVTSVERVYPTTEALATTGGLIPLNPTTTVGSTTNLLYALNSAATKCVDSKGYQVCALYKATLTNGGSQAVELSLDVKTSKNEAAKDGEGATKQGRTPFEDLALQVLDFESDAYSLALDAEDSPIAAQTLMQTSGQSVAIDGFTIEVPGNNSAEHYFVVYLNEPIITGEDPDGEGPETATSDAKDQSAQMGASYTGELIYTTSSTGGASNRLTGTFTVGE